MTDPAMQKLAAQLRRLYLLPYQRYLASAPPADGGADGQPEAGPLSPAVLEQHLRGEQSIAIELATAHGMVRTLVIDFFQGSGGGTQHWDTLCLAANAMQEQLGLPAPAVSISGAGYALWLSLETPVLLAEAQHFLQLLRAAYWPDLQQQAGSLRPHAGNSSVQLAPGLHQASGKWAAFINASMGAAFADDAGLDMAPPAAAQSAFLEGLQSMSTAQFRHALSTLQMDGSPAGTDHMPSLVPIPATPATPAGLLLQDATLEDIVNFLHSKNIEPTFRHLFPK